MTEKEAIALDLIIEKVLSNENPICSEDLKTELLMLEENESEHENTLEGLYEYLKQVTIFSISNVSLNSIERKNSITKKFHETGGFVKQLQDELNRIEKAENIEKLKTENLILQNTLLELQTKQQRRYILYSSISFILGAIVTNGKEILQLLQSAFQE